MPQRPSFGFLPPGASASAGLWLSYVVLVLGSLMASASASSSLALSQDLPPESTHDTYRADLSGRSKACNLLVGIDEPLWERYDQDMGALTKIVQDHISFANKVFSEQVFNDDSYYDGEVYFRLARIQVMFGSCDGFEDRNCTQYREEYLKTFDDYDFSEFCLAYMFTYLDFHNGTAGLANIGTVCRPSGNVGFVTLLNYNQERPMDESYITFAHELGHSFGAQHDSDTDDDSCKEQGFIMSEYATESGPRSARFSTCSVESIHEKLAELPDFDVECFVDRDFEDDEDDDETPEVSLCGNGVVDPGEECDCGLEYQDCNDACCYAAHIDPADRAANGTAKPCSRADKFTCRTPPALLYGLYLPFTLMFAVTCVVGIVLTMDWKRERRCYRHVTQGNVKIVGVNGVSA